MTSESTDGKQRSFRHPFLQACGMFLGEMMCMVAYYVVKAYKKRRNRSSIEETQDEEIERPKYSPFIFLPPALCDMTATSIQYIGLTLTYASSFQMLRGIYMHTYNKLINYCICSMYIASENCQKNTSNLIKIVQIHYSAVII